MVSEGKERFHLATFCEKSHFLIAKPMIVIVTHIECLMCRRHQPYPYTHGGRARILKEAILYVYIFIS